jgi:hypothetical protein
MKKIVRENYRIEIIPNFGWLQKTHKNYTEVMDEIEKSIIRHIDRIGCIFKKFDEMECCEFCSYPWELDENGCPVCCDRAVEEWNKQQYQKP